MFDQFRNKFPINAAQWPHYTNYFKRMEVPAKTTLLKEGEISKKIFFIEKGCIRAWFNNDGKDVTFQFFFENGSVSSVESFRKNVPSLLSLETVEPCALWIIHKKDFEKISEEMMLIPEQREIFVNAIFERTFNYMRHFLSFIKDTPQQRYINLINEHPQIIKRVPQHYIASYLGITKVHLSRIKSKMAKQKI